MCPPSKTARNIEHIARHGVVPAEVEAVGSGEHRALATRDNRLMLVARAGGVKERRQYRAAQGGTADHE